MRRQPGFDRREDGDSARVAEHERALDVVGVKEALDRHAIRLERAQLVEQAVVNRPKAVGKTGRAGHRQRPAGDEPVTRAVGVHAPIPGADGPGIDAEHPHASEASISFSSMSTFDQTFLVSSYSSSASISFSICCAGFPSSLM